MGEVHKRAQPEWQVGLNLAEAGLSLGPSHRHWFWTHLSKKDNFSNFHEDSSQARKSAFQSQVPEDWVGHVMVGSFYINMFYVTFTLLWASQAPTTEDSISSLSF